MWGEGHISRGQPHFHPKGAGPVLLNFGGSLHLCLHSLTQNDQIRRGNTYGEGHVYEGQPRQCILHQCVVPFVNYNRVSFFGGCKEKEILLKIDRETSLIFENQLQA